MEPTKEKIMLKELHKLWKHQAAHQKKLCQRKECTDQQNNNKKITKFEIWPIFHGQKPCTPYSCTKILTGLQGIENN